MIELLSGWYLEITEDGYILKVKDKMGHVSNLGCVGKTFHVAVSTAREEIVNDELASDTRSLPEAYSVVNEIYNWFDDAEDYDDGYIK